MQCYQLYLISPLKIIKDKLEVAQFVLFRILDVTISAFGTGLKLCSSLEKSKDLKNPVKLLIIKRLTKTEIGLFRTQQQRR